MVIAYIILGICIFVYVSVLFDVWNYRRKAKSEWEQYWDEVFKNNKNK